MSTPKLNSQTSLRSIRLLAAAFFEFESFNRAFLRPYGLTPTQFDIIAKLGNTEGMNFRELGEQTLITKGTLTGVVDRLVAMKLVRRVAGQTDRRTMRVELTKKGTSVFEQAHPAIVREVHDMMQAHGYTNHDFKILNHEFARMRDVFQNWQATDQTAQAA